MLLRVIEGETLRGTLEIAVGKMEDTVGYARGGKEEQEKKAEMWAWLGQELQQARSMDKEVGCESAWVQEVGTCKVPNPMDEGRRRKKKSV